MKRIIRKLLYKFQSMVNPEMIGHSTWNGVPKKGLRISNTSHLSNKKSIHLGDNVFVGHFNYLDGNSELFIEEGVQVTNYVSIVTHSSHHAIRLLGKEYISKFNHDVVVKGKVQIGAYSYIGPHVSIMVGSKIGRGCIVSAFSYVNGIVPDYSIVRGTPAVVVGSTKEIDNELLKQYPELQECYFE